MPDKPEKDFVVMCIHDTYDFKVADRTIVFGYEPCGHMILQGSNFHYDVADFVVYSDGPIVHSDPNKIDVQKVVNMINDITNCIVFNQQNGLVQVESVMKALKYNIDVMNIKGAVVAPKNLPPEV